MATKLSQGLGMVPVSLKELAFNSFLLIYYNQVLGLSASLASLAITIALLFDAVSDPLVGSWSDNFRHRLGRRHPFMYAASLPFAVFIYLLFAPQIQLEPLQDTNLFAWLLCCAIGVRVSFTFFAVPWNAMFAELSDDYLERSELVAYRFAVGWIVGIVFLFSIYAFVFTANDQFAQGQLNPEHYRTFAWVLAITVFLGAFATTHLTRDQIPFLRQPSAELRRFSVATLLQEMRLAFDNRDFRILFFAVLASSVVIGTNQALQIYMNTYFWGFTGEDLKWSAFAVTGGLFAFLTVLPLQRRIDKKYLLVGCSVAIMLFTMVPVSLRFLGWGPANGSYELIVLVVGITAVNAYFATIGLIMFTSMIADTLDVQEHTTGLRQEGLFNAVVAFSGKVTTGVGILAAGLIVDHVVQMPQGATAEQITQAMVVNLGVMDAYVVPLFNLVWLWLAMQYGITRGYHAKVVEALKQSRASTTHNNQIQE